MAIHLVVDNYATHKHPGVKWRLAAHPRYQAQYTPTYTSCLFEYPLYHPGVAAAESGQGTIVGLASPSQINEAHIPTG
jgi:hypothetical protein